MPTGTLEFAAAAGGALEGGFLGDVLAQQRLGVAGPEFVQVAAHSQDDLLGVEHLAGVGGRAVLACSGRIPRRRRPAARRSA